MSVVNEKEHVLKRWCVAWTDTAPLRVMSLDMSGVGEACGVVLMQRAGNGYVGD